MYKINDNFSRVIKFVNKMAIIPTFRGRKVYEPPRYMTVSEAASQLLEILQTRDFGNGKPG